MNISSGVEKLPLYFRLGCIPIMTGMPPFRYWEKPSEGSRIPANRTDAGVFLSAEALGATRVYFIKDEHGLYEDDPKQNPKAKLISRISARELLERNLPDMIVERVVCEYLAGELVPSARAIPTAIHFPSGDQS